MTKNEIVKALDERGVKYDPNMLKSDLEKLLQESIENDAPDADSSENSEGNNPEADGNDEEASKESGDNDGEDLPSEPNHQETEPKSDIDNPPATTESPAPRIEVKSGSNYDGKGPVAIIKGERVYIRTYSEKDHGRNFRELAMQYCANPINRNCRMINDEFIQAIKVVYQGVHGPTKIRMEMDKVFKDREAALRFAQDNDGIPYIV